MALVGLLAWCIIDAAGGFQNYPEDYAIIEELGRHVTAAVTILHPEARQQIVQIAFSGSGCTA